MRALLTDFEGRTVFLTEEAWDHIISPPHDYMESVADVAFATLRAPDEVRRPNTRPENVRLYYRWITGTPVGDRWVCVVVKYLQDEAYLLTTYATNRIKAWGSYP